jgi:hypothetical protein
VVISNIHDQVDTDIFGPNYRQKCDGRRQVREEYAASGRLPDYRLGLRQLYGVSRRRERHSVRELVRRFGRTA